MYMAINLSSEICINKLTFNQQYTLAKNKKSAYCKCKEYNREYVIKIHQFTSGFSMSNN